MKAKDYFHFPNNVLGILTDCFTSITFDNQKSSGFLMFSEETKVN